MQDRVSLYPGRVKLEPVAGQANLYDLTRADQPTQEGTPLNKANLLSDATETAMFGSAANRTVDEAFAGLAAQIKLIMSNTASITLTLKDSAGHALPGVLVQGILTESGQDVYSGTNGVAAGYIAEGSQTIKVTGYADIEDYTETINVTKGTTITKALTLTTRNFLKITSSRSVKFSGNVNTVDVSVGGGGGGGSSGGQTGSSKGSGSGGGGGYCSARTGVVPTANTAYSAVIGAGGTAGAPYTPGYGDDTEYAQNGTGGGSSSFMGISAGGGGGGVNVTGGSGNGKGGNGVSAESLYDTSYPARSGDEGSAGSTKMYTSFTESVVYGGGGGGGACVAQSGYAAGTPASGANYGGDGAASSGYHASSTKTPPGDGQDGFGGGGGGGFSASFAGAGAKGGSGAVAIRMHLKSAT